MNTEFVEVVRPAAERVGWVLVHSTWQGAAVAAGLWVALAVGRGSATRRYAASCVAFVAIVAAMVVTFVRVEGTPRVIPMAGATRVSATADLKVTVAPTRLAMDQATVAAAPDVRMRIAPWLPVVVSVWAIGVAGLAIWHFGGWVRVRRMTRAGVAQEWEDRAHEIARRMGVSRGVRVVESALAGVPAVVGFIRPVILLPVGLAAEMSVGQVEAILAHELAHVRRNDYLVNLVQTAVETILFYHPAVWWISAQIRQEREHCCDDLAVAACEDRAAYARALARVEEVCGGTVPLATAAAGGSLLNRVRRLAGAETRVTRRATPLAAVVVAVACAAVMIALAEWPAHAAGPEPATRPAAERKRVRVIVGRHTVTVDGKSVEAAKIGEVLESIPDRDRRLTTVEIATAADGVPFGRYTQVFAACVSRAKALGMSLVSDVGVERKSSKAAETRPAAVRTWESGEYYVEGHIGRPGVYSLNGASVTLSQALIAAGMPTGDGTYVSVIRRDGDRYVAAAENLVVLDLFKKQADKLMLRPNDLVRITVEKLPPLGKATAIRPAPFAGTVGDVYIGGHVRRPGVYSVNGRTILTVGSSLASAGGLANETADETLITRRDGGRETQVRVSIRKILGGTEPDMYLQPGDIVNFGVPSADEAAGK